MVHSNLRRNEVMSSAPMIFFSGVYAFGEFSFGTTIGMEIQEPACPGTNTLL